MKAMPSYGALDENPPRLSLTKDAIRDIKPLLKHSEPSARAAAAYLLGTFGRDASVALPDRKKGFQLTSALRSLVPHPGGTGMATVAADPPRG